MSHESSGKTVLFAALILILSSAPLVFGSAGDGKITPKLSAHMKAAGANQEIPVIVVLKEEDGSVYEGIDEGKIKKRYGLIDAAALRLTAKEIDRLRNNPKVSRIYLDDIVKVSPIPAEEKSSALGINIDAVGATYAQNYLGYTGKGVTIAVVDSGIDYTHPDLGGCLGSSCKVAGGYDFVNLDSDPMDDTGHGTHCAGVASANGSIKGVAPNSRLLAVKVLAADGQGMDSDILAGIDWAVANGADIISLSLGGSEKPSDGYEALELICDAAVDKGVVIAAAMGNEGPGTGTIADMASSRKVISVAAIDTRGTTRTDDDYVADFSSRGPASFGRLKPEVSAPGTAIYSTYLGGGYATYEGTSMATPHVAGAAALLLEYNANLSPKQIKSILMQSAADVGGTVFRVGAGEINVTRAILSRINASINGEPVWEESIIPGMNATANIRIRNNKAVPVNLTITIPSIYDTEVAWSIPYTRFSCVDSISLNAGEEKEINLTFHADLEDNPGTYGGTIELSGSGESIRIPMALTLPLFGGGTAPGNLNDDCSAASQEGCGLSPSSVSEWGDWIFYKIKNSNGTTIMINLTWASSLSDLDMYIYSPAGELVNYSGEWGTNWEYAVVNDPVYDEYWVGVYAYDLADIVQFNLAVSYSSPLRVEPSIWQGSLAANRSTTLNFTLINDGTSDSGLALSTVCLKTGASKRVSDSIAQTGPDVFYVEWQKSTGGLDIDDARYLNASLRWSTPSKDLDLYFVYKEEGSWLSSQYMSTHDSDVYGYGEEDLSMIDVKQHIKTYSDVGIGIVNPGTTQSYTLTLNFTDEDSCSYASTSPSSITTLSANQNRTIQVSVNTASLSLGRSYDSSLIIEDDGIEVARAPIRFQVAAASTTTPSTSTTTTTTSTSTTTQAKAEEETVEINPGHYYYYRQWTNEVSENTSFNLTGLGYNLSLISDARLQLKQVNSSDASLPEHSDVVYPLCASNSGGTADLYFNGQKLVSFSSGYNGINDHNWSDGDAGYFGQWYCCGCTYTHNITSLLSETNNFYFQQYNVAASGYTKVTEISLILMVTNTTSCALPGDNEPCGTVTLSEVIAAVNTWSAGGMSLSSVINLINAWAG